MLEAHSGWEVYGEAVNRYEALTKAIRTETDLIILDLAMAEVEDLKAADEISKLLAGVQMVQHTITVQGRFWRLIDSESPKCLKSQVWALASAIEEFLIANVGKPLVQTSQRDLATIASVPE